MTQIPQEMLDTLVTSTREVFHTMVFQNVTPLPPVEGISTRPPSHVVGTIAFTGEHNGLVAFYSTTETANAITAALLGIPPADVSGEMPDAIGEVTNMIAGTFRTRMAEHGRPWAISVPTVTIGSDFHTTYVSDVRRVLFPFSMTDGNVFVELILMRDPS